MIYLEYDGSFEGLLTAVFEAYGRNIHSVRLCKKGSTQQQLFTEIISVSTDETKAGRVWKKLLDLFGKDGVRIMWKAWLSEQETADDLILETIRYGLGTGKNVLNDFGNIHVLQLQQIVKSVGRESHRMEAFVRFELTRDGLYYAVIEPDFNVLPLIAQHFEERYADQRWMIYDRRRNYGLYYDLTSLEIIDLIPNEMLHHGKLADKALAENESLYQNLWNDYFRSTNIASRKNTKLHLQHVPRRYWKYLTEKSSY